MVESAKTFVKQSVSSPRNSTTTQTQPTVAPLITLPKPTSKSKYSPKWEAYIAANLYLYTVPLAIFLRRARELDFSPKEFRRSITMVQRVLRVYSPEVVSVINSLLADKTQPLASAVAKHESILGEYCPTACGGSFSLESCRDDMHNLLEEIYTTHRKAMRDLDFFDKIAAYLGLGEVTAKEEFELKALVQKANVIVNFPLGYEVIPSDQDRASSKNQSERDDRGPERQANGFLTEKGAEALVTGAARCTALDTVPVGDSLYSRAKSYEIRPLVPLAIKASDWVNVKLGLVPESAIPTLDSDGTMKLKLDGDAEEKQSYWFRFNFRFLADYRTIIWIIVLCWLYKLRH